MQNNLQINWSNGSWMLFCRFTQQDKSVFGTAYFHTWPWSITATINHWKMRGCFKFLQQQHDVNLRTGQESHLRAASHCSSSLIFCWNEWSFSSDNCSKKHAAACKMGSYQLQSWEDLARSHGAGKLHSAKTTIQALGVRSCKLHPGGLKFWLPSLSKKWD